MKFKKWWVIFILIFSISEMVFSNCKNEYELTKEQINEIIYIFSLDAKLPSDFVQEIVQKESRYNIYATSYVNAKGLMQLLHSNHEWFSWKFAFKEEYNFLFQKYNIVNDPSDEYNPIYNLWYGIQYFRWILDTYSSSYWVALIIYNSGQKWYVNNEQPNRVSVNYANEIMRNWYLKRRYH